MRPTLPDQEVALRLAQAARRLLNQAKLPHGFLTRLSKREQFPVLEAALLLDEDCGGVWMNPVTDWHWREASQLVLHWPAGPTRPWGSGPLPEIGTTT
jgi:hypothetical protein